MKKGISPKICILCVRVKINQRSFEPFCVWILRIYLRVIRCHYLTNGDVTVFVLSSWLRQDNNHDATIAVVPASLMSAVGGRQQLCTLVFPSINARTCGSAGRLRNIDRLHATSCSRHIPPPLLDSGSRLTFNTVIRQSLIRSVTLLRQQTDSDVTS